MIALTNDDIFYGPERSLAAKIGILPLLTVEKIYITFESSHDINEVIVYWSI